MDTPGPERKNRRQETKQRRLVALAAGGLALLILLFWLAGGRNRDKPASRPEQASPPGVQQPPQAKPPAGATPPAGARPQPPPLPAAATGAVAFAGQRDGAWEIYGMLADGSDRRQLTHLQAAKPPQFVALSPDGLKVLFAYNTGGRVTSFVVDTDGKSQERRFSVAEPGEVLSAAWSPDGRYVAAAVRADGTSRLHLVQPDGTGWQSLGEGSAAWPSWDPQGLQLAYACEPGPRICTISRFGSEQKVLVDHREGPPIQGVAWSPDGRSVAYAYQTQIWVVDVRTRARVQVTKDEEAGWQYRHPTWSADGQRIVAVRWRDGTEPHMFMLAPSGEQGERFLPDAIPGPAIFPSWSGDFLK